MDPAGENSCLSQRLDNLSSKAQLQRKLVGSVTIGCWLILSSASEKKKSVKGLLAKVNVTEGDINSIKRPGDWMGGSPQRTSPFLVAPLWPPQSKIGNLVKGGCSCVPPAFSLLVCSGFLCEFAFPLSLQHWKEWFQFLKSLQNFITFHTYQKLLVRYSESSPVINYKEGKKYKLCQQEDRCINVIRCYANRLINF